MATHDRDAPTIQTQIDELRNATARLDERLKEGQTNLLAAIKTLFVETQEFAAGKRQNFPQAALTGVVFAYLRPRVVLVLGSLAAIAIAIGQIWLLAQQNTLIDQQNALMREQGEALRAQTAAVLLSGLDSDKPSEIQISLLTAFGDIGFDSLSRLARAPRGNAGQVVRRAFTEGIGTLSTKQRFAVLDAFMAAHTESMSGSPTGWLAQLEDGSYGGSGSPYVSMDRLPTDHRTQTEDVRATERDLARLMTALGSTGLPLTELTADEIFRLRRVMGAMYAEYFSLFSIKDLGVSTGGTLEASLAGFIFLDQQLSRTCDASTAGPAERVANSIGSVVGRGIRTIAQSENAQRVRVGTVIAVAIARVCAANSAEAGEALAVAMFDELLTDSFRAEIAIAGHATE